MIGELSNLKDVYYMMNKFYVLFLQQPIVVIISEIWLLMMWIFLLTIVPKFVITVTMIIITWISIVLLMMYWIDDNFYIYGKKPKKDNFY
jgi:hypothetical protein